VLSFPPTSARYIKLQLPARARPGPWGVEELFAYTPGEEPSLPPSLWDAIEDGGKQKSLEALKESVELIRGAPDLEYAHIVLRLAARNLKLPVDRSAIEKRLARRARLSGGHPLAP
jgi:hypothetical protein